MSVAGEPGDLIDALLAFLSRLEAAGLRYAIGGTIASGVFGEPRSAAEAEVIVELPSGGLTELDRTLGEDFRGPRGAGRTARASRAFSLLHRPTRTKIDVLVRGPSEISREHFERRRPCPLLRNGAPAWLLSPEVLVVGKLESFRRGGTAEDAWRDVLGILKVQAGRLDETWMRRHSAALGVSDLLERALKLQGPPPR
jgi:hypothetical protein